MAIETQATFVSYARDDAVFALQLAEDLKSAGASVWLDQMDIRAGQRWAHAVQDALTDCPRMLIILSPSSMNSTNVDDEISFALEERKPVIPVLYRDCKIPFRLRPYQYVDFRTDYARGLRVLLKDLGVNQSLGQNTEVPPAVPPNNLHASTEAPKANQRRDGNRPVLAPALRWLVGVWLLLIAFAMLLLLLSATNTFSGNENPSALMVVIGIGLLNAVLGFLLNRTQRLPKIWLFGIFLITNVVLFASANLLPGIHVRFVGAIWGASAMTGTYFFLLEYLRTFTKKV